MCKNYYKEGDNLYYDGVKYDNLTIIDENVSRIYQTENFLIGSLLSKKNTIIVSLDGDDWLPHNNILNILNDIYLSTQCLMTYGNYIEFPHRNIKWAWKKKTVEELNNIRQNSLSHLRTWRRELFLNIDIEDLKMDLKFPKMAGDVSVLLYMVEMYPEKCQYINNIMYVYNKTNILSDNNIDEKLQIDTAEYFFNKKSYTKTKLNFKNNEIVLKNSELNFLSELNIGNLKLEFIKKYLNYDMQFLRLETSNYIFKNTPYETMEHYNSNEKINNELDWMIFWNNNKIEYYLKTKNICNINTNKNPILGIIIISCKKRLDNALKQYEKFKKSNVKNCICKIFIGDLTLVNEYEENENIVKLKIPDNYESLILKVYCSIKWFYENHVIDYIFKTDEDIEINYNNLYDVFKNKIYNNIPYCGNVAISNPYKSDYHFNKCENIEINKTLVNIDKNAIYCSGGGYFLNNELIIIILQNYLKYKHYIYEDLAIGMCLNDCNIIPFHLNLQNLLNWNENEGTNYGLYFYRKILTL